MTIIHKECGTELKSSGRGDWGMCPKCNKRVDHLVWNGEEVIISEEAIIKRI